MVGHTSRPGVALLLSSTWFTAFFATRLRQRKGQRPIPAPMPGQLADPTHAHHMPGQGAFGSHTAFPSSLCQPSQPSPSPGPPLTGTPPC